ncbi:hypothetical protein [Virgibacillus sp. DJP39]|uniref:hypothetical protein n=1 Tax=Virgibacillus sp. DJP39 TaxID=3409790 RepID=UPI003BB674AE
MIPTAVHMLKYSESYKGSWVFRAAPVSNLASFNRSAVKAFIVKLYLPIFIVLCAAFTWIFSIRIVPDLFVVFLSGFLQTIISYKLLNDGVYPYTQSVEFSQDMNTGLNILLSLLAGLFALGHYFFLTISNGIYLYLGLLVVLNVVSWIKVFPNEQT